MFESSLQNMTGFYQNLNNTNQKIMNIAMFFALITAIILITWLILTFSLPNYHQKSNFNKLESLKLFSKSKNAEILEVIEDEPILNSLPHNNYTFSFWLYISEWYNSSEYGKWKHILHIGSNITDEDCRYKLVKWNTIPNQNPGVWMLPEKNKIRVVVKTDSLEYVDIDDIEIKEWVNILLNVNGKVLEVYKNGKLEKTFTLKNEPGKNNETLFVNFNKGFTGYIKNMEVIPKKVDPFVADQIYQLDK